MLVGIRARNFLLGRNCAHHYWTWFCQFHFSILLSFPFHLLHDIFPANYMQRQQYLLLGTYSSVFVRSFYPLSGCTQNPKGGKKEHCLPLYTLVCTSPTDIFRYTVHFNLYSFRKTLPLAQAFNKACIVSPVVGERTYDNSSLGGIRSF